MKLLIVSSLAVALAWCWDLFLRFLGWNQNVRVGIGAPLGEEIIKYSLAIIFNLPPWLLYSFFGLGEGCLEALHLKKRFDLKLILAGVFTHFGFGVFFCFNVPYGLSFVLGITLHLAWNNFLIYSD